MLMERAGATGRSGGRTTASSSTRWWPPVMHSPPPPGRRKSPVISGRAMIARTVWPAPWWRCRPRPQRTAVGRVVTMRSPRRRTTSTSSPHSAAARSTGHSSSRASSSGQPTVCASSHSRSAAPASRTWRISPRASAASVPGSGARCSSERAAVSVRSGSIATTCAPRFCASSTNGHWCRLADSRLAPHRMISRASTIVSGSKPTERAVDRAQRGVAAAVQIVVRSREAPRCANSRGPIVQPCTLPIVPAK